MKKMAAIVFSGVLVVYAAFATWAVHGEQLAALTIGSRGQLGDTFGVLNALFSSLGFAGILVTLHLQNKAQAAQARKNHEEVEDRKLEVDERRSLFNLEASIKAYQKALELLEDGNNDRATWIRAARILKHGKQLASGVTVEAHKLALELSLLDYRTAFRKILDQPAAFFYGATEHEYADGLENAARRASLAADNGPISEHSLYAVCEAADWPDNYDDPLTDDFTQGDIERLIFTARGLRDYLLHRLNFRVFNGEVQLRTAHLDTIDET